MLLFYLTIGSFCAIIISSCEQCGSSIEGRAHPSLTSALVSNSKVGAPARRRESGHDSGMDQRLALVGSNRVDVRRLLRFLDHHQNPGASTPAVFHRGRRGALPRRRSAEGLLA